MQDKLIEKITEIIEEKKGQDLKIYNLNGKSPFYDFSIVVTGSSTKNVEAMAMDIKKELLNVKGIEGLEEANWVLIDAGDFIINIFREEAREYYQIDKFYEEILK